MKSICYEYRPSHKRRGKPVLLPPKNIDGRQGFISVYGFDTELQNEILTKGGTYDISDKSLYSDILYIDIDKNEEITKDTKNKLISLGVTFEMYTSGSPYSYHFHIPIIPMYGSYIYIQQKEWVKSNFDGVDLSIYKPTGIIRINGSYHTKYPGRNKHLIFANVGKTLDISSFNCSEPKIKLKLKESDCDTSVNTENILDILLMSYAGEGNRNNSSYKIAFLFNYLGYDKDIATNEILTWNKWFCDPPLSNREILTTINSAFRRK